MGKLPMRSRRLANAFPNPENGNLEKREAELQSGVFCVL